MDPEQKITQDVRKRVQIKFKVLLINHLGTPLL